MVTLPRPVTAIQMRATPSSPTPAPALRRRMRSGEAGGRRGSPFGVAWLLLALACLALALTGKAEPDRAGGTAILSGAQATTAERAALTAESASDIANAAAAADEGEPDALPALREPSADKDPSGDKHRRSHGPGFPARAGLARVVPAATVAGHRGTSKEGRLPPAHAPPATC